MTRGVDGDHSRSGPGQACRWSWAGQRAAAAVALMQMPAPLSASAVVAEPLTKWVMMVVPAVGVIVGDDDGGAGPEGRGFDGVDLVDDEGLLVERIGVAGVSILISRGLEEADGGQVAGGEAALKSVMSY